MLEVLGKQAESWDSCVKGESHQRCLSKSKKRLQLRTTMWTERKEHMYRMSCSSLLMPAAAGPIFLYHLMSLPFRSPHCIPLKVQGPLLGTCRVLWSFTDLSFAAYWKQDLSTFNQSAYYFQHTHCSLLASISKHLWLYTEKAMAPHSSTLAWKIPWMEEPGRL